jgi:glycosyltransferase involved in cell wall biosynthesis
VKFLFLSSHAHLVLDPAAKAVSGGAELQVALLAAALVERGHEVVIVGGDTGQPDDRRLRGVRTLLGGKFHTGKLWDTLKALPVVLGIVAREKPDHTLILGWTSWVYFLLVFRRWLRTRLGFICSSDTEVNGAFRRQNPFRGFLFEYGMRHADFRWAMTDYQKEQFHRLGLSCGLYRNLILPRVKPSTVVKDIGLLWVSRCQTIKRPHLFLDLAARLPETRCVMICPDEDRPLWEELELRARNLPNVHFLIRVPYHEIQDYYDRAQIFVNTSEAEGFPNSFIQAAQGATAILSLNVDPDGVLTRFGAGLCADDNLERFFELAEKLVSDRPALEKLQGQALRFVTELHDTDRNVDAFLAGLEPAGISHPTQSAPTEFRA